MRQSLIIEAVKALKSRCDGARSEDFVGFNKPDTLISDKILYIANQEITDELEATAYDMLRKYKKQLASMGIDFDQFKRPEVRSMTKEERYQKVREVRAEILDIQAVQSFKICKISETHLKVSFSYSPMVVGAIKGVPKSRYNAEDKSWVIPIAEESLKALKTAINDLGVDVISAEINEMLDNPNKFGNLVGRKVILNKDGRLCFSFEYDPKMVGLVKEIPNARFSWENKNWLCPVNVGNFEKIISVIKRGGFKVEEKVLLLLKEQKSKIENNLSDSMKLDSEFSVTGLGGELRPFQKAGVEYLTKNKHTILADEMGCISGDTIVVINRNLGARKITLEKLFHKFYGGKSGNKKWDLSIPTKTSSMNEDGVLSLNEIREVLDKGVRDIIQITAKTTDGKIYKLKLTPDHEVRTKSGWCEAGKLTKGRNIAVNGIVTAYCNICKKETEQITSSQSIFSGCKRCMYRLKRQNTCKNGFYFQKNGYVIVSTGMRYHPRNVQGGVYQHHLVYEAFMNGLSYDKWCKKITFNELENAWFVPQNMHIHHKNGNCSDNRLKNLELISVNEHTKKHKKIRNIRSMCVHFAKIVKIEKMKPERVFDIVMSDPHRNFIANGIVVHNCGKTVEGLAAVEHNGAYPCIITCPASVRLNWKQEIKKWLPHRSVSLFNGSDIEKTEFIILNYEKLKKLPEDLKKKCCIFDESHRLKNYKAQCTKAAGELAKGVPFIYLLSGTPMLNRPQELISQLTILGKIDDFGGFWKFAEKYCRAKKTRWGWDLKGASNLDELKSNLRKICMIRREKKDVLPELPAKQRSLIPIEIDNVREYKKAEKDLIGFLKEKVKENEKFKKELFAKKLSSEEVNLILSEKANSAAEKAYRAEALVRISALRKIAALGKVAEVSDWLVDFVESGKKLVLFCYHKEILYQIKDILTKEGVGVVSLCGDDKEEERQKAINSFQNNGDCQVIICTLKAGGEGITLTAASDVAFLEVGWKPAELDQAEDRCLAEGQLIFSLERGYVAIEDINIGEHVYTALGRFKKVTDKWSKEHSGIMVEIRYARAATQPLICTDNHQILIEREGSLQWVRSDQLKMSDYMIMSKNKENINVTHIDIPRTVDSFQNNFGATQKNGRYNAINQLLLDDELCFLIGWYLADGFSSIKSGKGRFVSWCDEKIASNDDKFKLLKKFADDNGIGYNESIRKSAIEIRLYSADLARYFHDQFGFSAHTKRIPEWVLNLPVKKLTFVFDGYISGDGYKRKNTVEWSSVSTQLAVSILLIAIKLNYSPSIRYAKAATSWVGGVSTTISSDEYVRHKIHNIKQYSRGKVKVWDISVEDDESFLTGNCIVHNCHRIGQVNAVNAWYFKANETIEDMIYDLIESKRDITDINKGSVLDEFLNKFIRI